MSKATKISNKWIGFGLFGLIVITSAQWSLQLSPWVTIFAVLILIISAYFFLRTATHEIADTDENAAADRFLSRNNARSVGLKLQGLGKLSLAFEKFKQCSHNHDSANLLYNLAIDFQIKSEPENAKRVLQYIATFEPNFKDVKERLSFFEPEPITIVDDSIAEDLEEEEPTAIEPYVEKRSFIDTIQEKFLKTADKLESQPDTEEHETSDIDEELSDYPRLYGSRYKVIKLLGKGTTGAVFKGKDLAADRLLAIKVLNLTSELDPDQLDEYKFRFHREADTAGNLEHPNIVKIYDNGETEGFAYIVMEYVDGINLRYYARADKLLHPKKVLKLIAQSADALTYAHKQSLIHRDIKPANILYNQSDDFVKLTDFGIAKIPDSTRTRAGSILGTPLYMSPEQLAGETLDARSDLYSLGVTLYHLLTGSPPFRPKTMAELLRSITHERHKDIAEINPGTPACIAWTVNKALEKDPDKRFQSAASMANKLRECEMMLDG